MAIAVGKNNVKNAGRLFACLVLAFFPPESFGDQIRNYNIEDGLAQSQVHSILQDSRGYLWIGTYGGGVSRYDGLTFTNYGRKEGLSDGNVLSIIEDHAGHLWFATLRGVCKYDGITFTTLSTKDGLASHSVYSILEDREGRLWFGTDRGLSRYDGLAFTNFYEKDGLAGNVVRSIIQDRNGHFWFGTDGGGVGQYDGKTFTTLSTKDGLASNSVYSILLDREGRLWFGTDRGLSRYDGLAFTNFYEKDGLAGNVVRSIIQDRNGDFWFGTNGGGVSKYDGKTFTNLTVKDGLSSNFVWSSIEDREGNLWFGTYRGGLDQYTLSPFTKVALNEGVSDQTVRTILEDRQGRLWFGTYQGGVVRVDGKSIVHFRKKDGLADDFVLTAFEDLEGRLWFGTYRGVSRFDVKTFTNFSRRDGLSDDIIRAIIQDREGRLWFGTNTHGICRFDGAAFTRWTTANGLNSDEITAFVKDRQGAIWIGTRRGINIFDGDQFINFSEIAGLGMDDYIYAIREDSEGHMWFGAYGGRIIEYTPPAFDPAKPKEKKEWRGACKIITSQDGLPDDRIVSLIFDPAGDLWIGAENGIDKLDLQKYKNEGQILFKHYGQDEIFPGIECIHNAVHQDRQGNLWFGTLRGAVRYNAEKDRPNEVEPLTHIVNLRLLSKDADLSKYARSFSRQGLPMNLILPHHLNSLAFDFIGLSLAKPEKVRYQYQLEGLDNSWSPMSKETSATYRNLPPGEYVFKVIACNNDGLWNKTPDTYRFEITPPYWKRWWFQILVILTAAGGIQTYIKFRIRKLEKSNLELEKLTLVASKTDNAVLISDAAGTIEWVNASFTKTTGYSLEGLRKFKKNTLGAILDKILLQGQSLLTEYEIDTQEGNPIWLSVSLTPIFNRKRELNKYVVLGLNITERRKAEEALRESEAKYRALFECANDAVFILNAAGVHMMVNQKAADMLGYRMEELIGLSMNDIVAPSEFQKAEKKLEGLLRGESFPTYERFFRKKDGTEFPVEITVALIRDREGKPFYVQSIVRDITERKRAEEALQESQKQFQALTETTSDFVWEMDANGVYTYCSPQIHELWGYKPEDMIGKTPFDLMIPEDREHALKMFRTMRESPSSFKGMETRSRDNTGRIIELETSGVPFFDIDGRLRGYRGISRDVTERKRSEDALRESEEKYRSLASTTDSMYLVDRECRYIFMNEGHLSRFGLQWGEVVGRPYSEFHSEENTRHFAEKIERAFETNKSFQTEHKSQRDNKYFLRTFSPVVDSKGSAFAITIVSKDITERKRAEEALQISEAKLKEAQALGRMGSWEFDLDKQTIQWSDQTYRLYERDPSIGPPNVEEEAAYYSHEQAERLHEYARIAAEQGRALEYDLEARLPSGRISHFAAALRPIKDESGRIVKLIGTVQDITERKRAEEALRENEERFRTLYENSTVGLYRTTPDGRIYLANPTLVRMLGYSSFDDLSNRNLEKNGFEPSYPRTQFVEIIEKDGEVKGVESAWKRKDGTIIFVRESARAVRDSQAKTLYYDGTVEDITERKRAEEILQESEERYKSLFSEALDGICLADAETGMIIDCNNTMAAMVGRDRAELIGQHQAVLHPSTGDKAALSSTFRQHLTDKAEQVLETQIVTKTGEIREVEIKANLLNLRGSKMLQGIFRDTTVRKRAEETLRKSEEKYRGLTENINLGIYRNTVGPEGKFIEANPANIRMFGYKSKEEFLAINVSSLYQNPEDRNKFNDKMFKDGFVRDEELRLKKKDGSFFFGSVSAVAVKDEQGHVKYYDGIIADITERKRAEEEKRKNHAELKEFVHIVSHDLKNPVVSIQGFCSLIMKNHIKDLNEKALFYIQRMQANAVLMTDLLEDLVELSRIGRIEDKKTKISVQEVIKSVWAEANTSLAAQNVEFVSPDNLPQLCYSEKRLYQIFYNLLSNALKFRYEERKTKVEIGHQEDKDHYVFFVRDNGIGIEQKHHNKIFESFSQLKDIKSEGTGMGLAIVKKIVEANQGKVWVESRKGAGSTFYFTIPKNVKS